MHGLLRCNINTGVHARAQSGRVTQRCHNSPVGKRRLASANYVTHRKRAEDFGRFWKSQSVVEIRPASGEDGWFSLARGDLCGRCHTCWEGGYQIKKPEYKDCASLSSCRKTFKLKGNKKFRTRTEKSLRVFRISRFLCSIFMDIRCTFHT